MVTVSEYLSNLVFNNPASRVINQIGNTNIIDAALAQRRLIQKVTTKAQKVKFPTTPQQATENFKMNIGKYERGIYKLYEFVVTIPKYRP